MSDDELREQESVSEEKELQDLEVSETEGNSSKKSEGIPQPEVGQEDLTSGVPSDSGHGATSKISSTIPPTQDDVPNSATEFIDRIHTGSAIYFALHHVEIMIFAKCKP